MDKYDDRALTLDILRCVPCDCGHCVPEVAKALRESAAQAYMDVFNNGRSYKYCADAVDALRANGEGVK